MKDPGFVNTIFVRYIRSLKNLVSRPRDTECNELKMRVKLLEKLLEEKTHSVEKAKSVFLKNIYHEIRTPLNVIVGFSNLLEFNNNNVKDTRNYLSYIRESSADFLRKIDDLIQASIIEAGIVKIDNSECKLYDIMGELHSYFSFHKHVIDKDVAFLMSVPEELKETLIICDAYRVKQVIGNLLLNAFKFTHKGVVEFGFKIVKEEIEFFIRDTGIGGLEGKEDIVFNCFSKIDNSDTSPEGLGLGLNLASKLIRIMGGRIWYDSEADKGTTFYFTVPYKQVHSRNELIDQLKINNAPIPKVKIASDKTVVY
jgi:signal transduction histidine kinase